MARRRTQQWGITYSTRVNLAGYEWSPIPGDSPVLVPRAEWQQQEDGTVVRLGLPSGVRQENGVGVVRRAKRRMVTLADRLYAVGHDALTDEQRRAEILAYANDFGTILGDANGATLKTWMDEIHTFVLLDEVATAYWAGDGSGELEEFSRRVSDSGDNWGLSYRGTFGGRFRIFRIAKPGDTLQTDHLKPIDLYQELRVASARRQAIALVGKEVRTKLHRGMSFSPGTIYPENFVIGASCLLNTLYLRLWMDIIEREPPTRRCLQCGTIMKQAARGRPRKFCSPACSQKSKRQRAAQRGE